MEGKTGELEAEIVLADEVILEYEKLQSNELKTAAIQAENRDILKNIRDRIASEGIPDEVRLEAGVILAAGRHPMIERGMHSRRLLERLKEIDKTLQEHGGETIAWLSSREVVDSHRTPGPDETHIEQLLNLGILPHEARIIVNKIGEFFVPVAQHVSIRAIDALPGQELDFNESNIIAFSYPRQEATTGPDEIFLHPSRLLSTRNTLLVGNKAVEEMAEENGLNDEAPFHFAVEALMKSFRASNPDLAETPPAA